MVKVGLHFVLLFCSLHVFGQGHRSATELIRNEQDAEVYAERNPSVTTTFLCNDFHRKPLGNNPDTLKAGDLLDRSFFEVRLVAKQEKEIYRFKMISLFERQEPNAAAFIDTMQNRMKAGASFMKVYAEFMPIPPATELETGDMGWVDADRFTEEFSKAIKASKKGDIFTVHDTVQGWHNLIYVTHEPKQASGFLALQYQQSEANSLPRQKTNHAIEIRSLKGATALVAYAKEFPEDVSLELISKTSSPFQFSQFTKEKLNGSEEEGIYFDDYEKRYRWIKDTSVVLYSMQYIYLNGAEMSKKEKDAAIKDIYKKFNDGVPFEEIIETYWPNNNGMSTMSNIDGGLLDPDFVAKLDETKVGELFVARVSQSYFIGVPLEKPKVDPAYLVLAY